MVLQTAGIARHMDKHEHWLLELTRTPTASGREGRVIEWVRRWAARRRNVALCTDRFGNLELRRRRSRSTKPIYFIAHMDHPAFVVRKIISPNEVKAEFRGGVHGEFFNGSNVMLHHDDKPPRRGVVQCTAKGPTRDPQGEKIVSVRFGAPAEAGPGDVLTWDTGRQHIRTGLLHTLSADNLAGVAAAISAFDEIHKSKAARRPDVRVLLTRCEEIGLVGATAVCQTALLPKRARLIVLENSRSFPESPIGGGPIVRIGDRLSTFDPDLTRSLCGIAQGIEQCDPAFNWQRKLMVGGSCEATAFCAFGYTTGCVCLPLGNYHNMDPFKKRIAAEYISLNDYRGLVRLLIAVGRGMDKPKSTPSLKTQLTRILARHRHLLK